MTDFMEMEILQKGTLVSAECPRCGAVAFAHEWADFDFNGKRDAMQEGKLNCDQCNHIVDSTTFHDLGRKWYAGRYSAPGYLDCTDYEYDTNLRRLEKTLRDLYGENDE